MNGRLWLIVGALIAGSGVGCGALGAHWFEGKAKTLYADEVLRERREANWETGAHYQILHGLAIVATGLAALHFPQRRWTVAGASFTVGTVLFSGSLYLISLSGVEKLSATAATALLIPATPLGGIGLLIGWGVFVAAALALPAVAKRPSP